MNLIVYIDSKKRPHLLNVLDCIETKPNKKGRPESTTFKWVANHPITDRNVLALANDARRPRWNIENRGFNVRKNGGYELKHAYTADPVSAEIFSFFAPNRPYDRTVALLRQSHRTRRPTNDWLGKEPRLPYLRSMAQHALHRSFSALEALSQWRFQIRFRPDTS